MPDASAPLPQPTAPAPQRTLLQDHGRRLLTDAWAGPQPSTTAFFKAWAAADGDRPLNDFDAFVAALTRIDGGALGVLARLRGLAAELGWLRPGSGSRPAAQTTGLLTALVLVAVEHDILHRGDLLRQPATPDLLLVMDQPVAAAIVGACLLNRGLQLAFDPHSGALAVGNAISDVMATAYRFSTPDGVVRAELGAWLGAQSEGGGLDARKRHLRAAPGQQPSAAWLKAQLGEHKRIHKSSPVFVLPAASVPAPLADPVARAEIEAQYGVSTILFGDPGQDDPALLTLSRELQQDINDHLHGLIARLHGLQPSAAAPVVAAPRLPLVFVSYSHDPDDKVWCDRVVKQLKVLELAGHIELWVDTRGIGAGQDWDEKIKANLRAAHVAVMLISENFLSSSYVAGTEVPELLQRQASDGMGLVPVLVRPCAWNVVPWVQERQLRPGSTPLLQLSEAEAAAALADIAREVAQLCQPRSAS